MVILNQIIVMFASIRIVILDQIMVMLNQIQIMVMLTPIILI